MRSAFCEDWFWWLLKRLLKGLQCHVHVLCAVVSLTHAIGNHAIDSQPKVTVFTIVQ